MGLLGMAARTAVVAGTATHVAGNVQRRQQRRWAQKDAAQQWLAYLRSRPVQERALTFGFRPADPAVPIKTADASNPFTRLAEHGIQVDVPPVAEIPEGSVVRNLLTMWSRVVAANR